MTSAEVCDPRFEDGVDYVCFRVVEKLERNRAETNPLRYTSPAGSEKFLCTSCLVEVLNSRPWLIEPREDEDFDPLP